MLVAPARAQAPDPLPPPAQFPATAAGALGRALVEAVNSPDTTAIGRFLAASHAPQSQQARAELDSLLRALRQQGGGVTPRSIRQASSGAVVVGLWADRHPGAGVSVVLAPHADDSARLDRLSVGRVLRPGDALRRFPAERMDDARMAGLIEAELRRLEALDRLSGVVLVARGDDVLYEGTFGMEDPRAGRRMTTRSRFHLASIPKMITAVAVGQLVEEGKLRFDDTLGALLPELPWTAPARGITLRHLLTHTSGMPRPREDRPDPPTSIEHVARFAAEPLQFAPGQGHAYSNEGFITLAAVVEKVTGRRFQDHVRERILVPAGMHTFAYDAPADSLADRAFPQPREEGDLFGVRPRQVKSRGWGGGGAGGGHASARDLLAFSRAVVEDRLLSPAMMDTLQTPRVPWDGGHYGYGFSLREVAGRPTAGHRGGGPPGMALCNDMDFFLDGSYTVIVLTNYDAPFCAEVKDALLALVAAN
ncbi:MAG TPA: serine hydrolase domain-containing protein [Longimicrobium sp.]|nr:serine hydrolase domain-containing protein [Longimicrobium sp.]